MTVQKYFGKTNSELYDEWDNYHEEIINGSEWRCHKNAAEWIMNTVDEAEYEDLLVDAEIIGDLPSEVSFES